MQEVDEFLATEQAALTTLTKLQLAAVAAFVAAEPDYSEELRQLRDLSVGVRTALSDRYRIQSTPGDTAVDTFEGWVLSVDDLIHELRNERFPFFRGAQDRQRYAHVKRAADAIAQSGTLLDRFRKSAFEDVCAAGPAAVEQFLRRVDDQIAEVAASVATLPPGAAAVAHAGIPAPGTTVAPLVFEVGSVAATTVELTVSAGGTTTPTERRRTVALPVPAVQVPMLLSLDRCGGLVTSTPETANAMLLHALATLPAGRVTCTVFDPQRLGDSVNFVYALGDAAERVIGAKVRTTQSELAELLLSLEQHITFVTQKYLQGQHQSLTEYNTWAGEIAEPYRLLVLYDYPHGFSRSAQYADEEALARLGKIVSAGPRCGVFTIVVDPNDVVQSYPDSFYATPLRSLPCLRTGRPVAPSTLATLLARPGGTPHPEAPALAASLTLPDLRRPYADDGSFEAAAAYSEVAQRPWTFTGVPMPDAATQQAVMGQVARALALAEDVRVSPDQVAALYDARVRKDAGRDGVPAPSTARFDNEATWWGGDSSDGIAVAFGRVGASDVGVLRLNSKVFSGALVGGRPGAGKSVLLHSIITGLALTYSPEELELYLVDFKEGVEFKQYADLALPHARVVAIESERDFGLSVVEGLDREIARRGALFRGSVGGEAEIGTYRRNTGLAMPRILLVIDEFHVLFDRDDRLSTRAAELLDRIIRQGRAFGVHTILASQTIAGVAALGRHTLNQVPIRIALQSSDTDSRLLLADDNADAHLLTRPGEGILNTKGGAKDANQRFQAAYLEPERRDDLLRRLRERADEAAFDRRPVVFEGNAPACLDDVPPTVFSELLTVDTPAIPLGLPLSLDAPLAVTLRREPGSNLLVIGDDEQTAALVGLGTGVLAAAGVACDVIDFGGDPALATVLDEVHGCPGVRIGRRREFGAWLGELAEEVEKRHAVSDYALAPRCLVLAGLQRARDLDASSSDDAHGAALESVLRDGPDVGVHVVASFDKPVSMDRRLPASSIREFGQRVLFRMGKEDSYRLIGSELAGTMNSAQATFHDDDHAVTVRFRPFTPPGADWVGRLLGDRAGPRSGNAHVG